MATANEGSLELEALKILKSTEPPVWLAPSPELSRTARTASEQLFSFLKTYTPKSPLDRLLVEGFDAEQIWQQVDLQSQPLLSSLRREVKKFEKNPEEIGKIKKVVVEDDEKGIEEERRVLEEESDGFDEELDDGLDDDDEEEEEEEEEEKGDEKEEKDGGSDSEGKEMDEEKKGRGGIEDEFLKINELQEYLEEDEAREYGLKDSKGNKNKRESKSLHDDDKDEDGDEDEDEEDDEDLGMFDGDDDEDAENLENARYEDFFGAKKKKIPNRKPKSSDESEEDLDLDDEQYDSDDDDEAVGNQKDNNLSTHEKQLKRLQSEIEQMEKANLDPKSWTMQGEVTAAQRPKNSALEVDLDFQHNVRPAPVITEEFTASLEEMIKKRIVEEQFDDIEKAPSLPSKAPRELKELDENKSQRGLAEVYEEEYVKTTNPAAAPLSFSDEQKKEASILFKKLCLKLDALSHFHFTPKPVIDDMSIQANVPALAMEEIAPIAVSDAAMLAPEEIFAGKGDVKEEAELTQAERKRRRANKKRRHKAEAAKRMVKKARDSSSVNQNDGNEE